MLKIEGWPLGQPQKMRDVTGLPPPSYPGLVCTLQGSRYPNIPSFLHISRIFPACICRGSPYIVIEVAQDFMAAAMPFFLALKDAPAASVLRLSK